MTQFSASSQKKTKILTQLAANVTGLGFVGLELLSDDGEVDLMRGQTQHDEVSVGTTEDMLGVGVVVRLGALLANVVHDLVFPLAGHVGIGEDDL